jgi:hypothetical protein
MAAVVSFLIMVILFSIWAVLTLDPTGVGDVILTGIAGAIMGAIIGGISAAIIWFVDRVTRSRTTNRETLLQVFWILTALGAILGALVGWFVDKTLSSAIMGVPVCGLLGLASAGVLVVLICAIERSRKPQIN